MPQINRARIINFTYNNSIRNILDETFDFYQGENALLNLKNGGGKSVLVQILLQPIIPKAKLMGRRIEDFFKGKKTPSYILIEWKLEDQGGYLLTGICLAKRETQVREQDEENNSIKYFTFTSYYRESNLFDITNIPVIRENDQKIYIEDFKDAKRFLATKEKDKDYNIKLYAEEEDDKTRYRKDLESYNIFQDEWKSIVLKINESEGGVIEIFERCKTSQQLMNDWILKSIEKVVNKEDGDQKKLEQMLENLVEEMISNEQFIYEKEIYEEFLKEMDGYLSKLNDLTKSIDKETDVMRCISKMYYFLKSEINKMGEEINTQEDKIDESEKELKRIDLEERSKEYYDQKENVDRLSKLLEEESEKYQQIKERKDIAEDEELVQKAARDYESIKKLSQEIAGIKEAIEKIKNSGENNEKIRNLEFSLKVAYVNALEKLKEKYSFLDTKEKEITNTLNELDIKIKEHDNTIGDLQNKKGGAESDVQRFERDEAQIAGSLNFLYERNLLGEIDNSSVQSFIQSLEKRRVDLNDEKDRAKETIDKLTDGITKAEQEIDELRKSEIGNRIAYTNIDTKINEYEEAEKAIKPVFEKYAIDFNKRFYHQMNQDYIKSKINEMKKTERELDLSVRNTNENIISLREGTLHVSKEFRQWLINNEISFETGENYLRKQNENIRGSLVEQNPILPFAFLLYEDDIEKLTNADIGLNIHQMVPILSYSDINSTLSMKGNSVQIHDKIQFMCLFDNRMIYADNLEAYITELDKELNENKEQLKHYRHELERAEDDLQLLKHFTWDKNYIYDLERDKDRVENLIKSIKDDIKSLESKKDIDNKSINEFKDRINDINNLLKTEDEKEQKFYSFLEENKKYLYARRLFSECAGSIDTLIKEKQSINTNKNKLTSDKEGYLKNKIDVAREIKVKEEKLELYKDAHDGVLFDDDIGIMEERLGVLKSNITSDLKRLENDFNTKQNDFNNKNNDLQSYNIPEDRYVDVRHDSFKLQQLRMDIKRLADEVDKADRVCRKIDNELQKSNGKLESAEKEVRKLAEGPIEPQFIKLNFANRRKMERDNNEQANDRIKDLRQVISKYGSITNKIDGLNIRNFEVDISYTIKKEIGEDYKELSQELRNLHQENEKYESNVNIMYYKISNEYKSRNKHVENIFLGLDPLVQAAEKDKDKYYYLGERILNNKESLSKLIQACEQRLSNVEKNKKDMIQHSYLHAKQVFDEIQKIAENSSIQLDGKSRQMMKIDMVPLEEAEEDNINKMKAHVESSVNTIKEDMKNDRQIDEIRKKISKYMSTNVLLNVLSDLGKMIIKAYKIDINVKNSGYKTWEQVMKENSGGERFVSFFAVLVALMSYTRMSMKYVDDYQRNKDTKVLIMDNPFGPISSEHLLKPLFDIARRYNTQLICLTDLKQNSIMNCFNLIYMIKIRLSAVGTNEYIQLEKQIKEEFVFERDERLEKAVFKTQGYEQMSLI